MLRGRAIEPGPLALQRWVMTGTGRRLNLLATGVRLAGTFAARPDEGARLEGSAVDQCNGR